MDYRLIELCKVGDSAAIEGFVQTYQQDVYRLALSILDNATEADEATQDVLLAALRSLDSFRGASSLKTWLFPLPSTSATRACNTLNDANALPGYWQPF